MSVGSIESEDDLREFVRREIRQSQQSLNLAVAWVLDHVPTDDDFARPFDGMLVVDTADHRLYAREGGAWKYAALS